VIAADCVRGSGLTVGQIVAYWEGIDYRLEKTHRTGVERFFALCVKHGLLSQQPALEFLPA
jgi:predicted solute-binding protein